MAQLNTRGTLTRSRWDYFEHSDGIAFCFGSVTSGAIGAYFANNSSGATAIDIYAVNWSASAPGTWAIALLQPPLVVTPLTPTEQWIFPLAPDVATPPGFLGMHTAISSAYRTFIRYSNNSSGAQMAPIMGSYFATLPPGWALSVGGLSTPNPCELSFTVWYQYVTDNIAPAV